MSNIEQIYDLCNGRFRVFLNEDLIGHERIRIQQSYPPREMQFDLRDAETGLRRFVQYLMEEQKKAMEDEFEKVQKAVDAYARGRGTSFYEVSYDNAYYAYRLDVMSYIRSPNIASNICIELPDVEYTYTKTGSRSDGGANYTKLDKDKFKTNVKPQLPTLEEDLILVAECVDAIHKAYRTAAPLPLPTGSNSNGHTKGLFQTIPGTFDKYNQMAFPVLDEEALLKNLGIHSGQKKSQQASNAKNPAYWAHSAEDKINGVLQQAQQNLGPGHETTVTLKAISDCLSDHISHLGGE